MGAGEGSGGPSRVTSAFGSLFRIVGGGSWEQWLRGGRSDWGKERGPGPGSGAEPVFAGGQRPQTSLCTDGLEQTGWVKLAVV